MAESYLTLSSSVVTRDSPSKLGFSARYSVTCAGGEGGGSLIERST